MTRAALIAIAVPFFCFVSLAASAAEAPWTVSLKSAEVFQGGIVEIKVAGGDMARVKGSLGGQKIIFSPTGGDSYSALLGVDLDEKPGARTILIRGSGQGGARRERVLTLQVTERAFPEETLSVSPAFDRLDEATLNRVQKEQARMARLWATSSPQRLWDRDFIAPVSGGVTSPFGLRRIINGAARSPHAGIDLKGSLGAEVVAANRGRVVLRDEFFFSGRSLVLDHGGGLYTMYFHLADFRVAEGAHVRRGDLIGWVGMTGRVTGPHLHWGVRLSGARVDPLELLSLK